MKKNRKPLTLLKNINELMTLEAMVQKKARGVTQEQDLSLIKKAALLIEEGKIKWVGEQKKIPKEFARQKLKELDIHDNIFPGFIDPHTHTLFAGDRSHEFELKNRGVSYLEIAQQGGGIAYTVEQTRRASSATLKKSLQKRLDYFLQQGVTTVEIKSGYGLSFSSEMRMLQILKSARHPVDIVTTFLGAHALPKEFSDFKLYIEELKKNLAVIKKKKLSRRVDIFVEKGFFAKELASDYLDFAKKMGFEVTIHADQLSLSGGADLAVTYGALSADHLVCVGDKEIKNLARSETTCVLLPIADFYTHCPYPPARKMLEAGCRLALATDFNPGTAPTQNIQFLGLLARTMMQMTLPEVFTAMTLGAAYSLGESANLGSMSVGKTADFFISSKSWDELFYDLSPIPIQSVWKRGEIAMGKRT